MRIALEQAWQTGGTIAARSDLFRFLNTQKEYSKWNQISNESEIIRLKLNWNWYLLQSMTKADRNLEYSYFHIWPTYKKFANETEICGPVSLFLPFKLILLPAQQFEFDIPELEIKISEMFCRPSFFQSSCFFS
jgi:hypothetical protein